MRVAVNRDRSRAINPSSWGYRVMYYQGEHNHCPGCGHSNWHIGRASAQCAFCDTTLLLAANRAPAFDLYEAA